jgi:hypothetical protein
MASAAANTSFATAKRRRALQLQKNYYAVFVDENPLAIEPSDKLDQFIPDHLASKLPSISPFTI